MRHDHSYTHDEMQLEHRNANFIVLPEKIIQLYPFSVQNNVDTLYV